MEITGKLIKILPETRGESQRGAWVRGSFVIETDGEYPRQVAFTTFGEDRLAMVNNTPLNSPVVVSFMPESREFHREGEAERWFTDLRCSRIQAYTPGQMPAPAMGYSFPQAAPAQPMAPAAPATPVQPAAPAVNPSAAQGTAFASPLNPQDDLPF